MPAPLLSVCFQKSNNSCDDSCETTDDGMMRQGRVCDYTCEDGNPYGTRGCNASEGLHGAYCRTCFYSADEARVHDSHTERAIM